MRAGPRLTNCNTNKFESKDNVSKIRVFKNGDQITGMAIGYYAGLIV